MPNFVALSLMVSDKNIFKVFKKISVQPEFKMVSNSFNKLYRGPWQKHLCEISSKSDVSEKTMFKEKVNRRTDAQRTTDHDISSLAYGQWS